MFDYPQTCAAASALLRLTRRVYAARRTRDESPVRISKQRRIAHFMFSDNSLAAFTHITLGSDSHAAFTQCAAPVTGAAHCPFPRRSNSLRPDLVGAADRGRTGTVSLPRDFKSLASACSATAAFIPQPKIKDFRPGTPIFSPSLKSKIFARGPRV